MTRKRESADHDNPYKLLFRNPEMVADLLKGYLAREWIGELDLTRMEPIPGEQQSDTGRDKRYSDCIWRVPWRDAASGEDVWLYVYLLLEFQSRVDPTMPVRMMAYLGLLYQRLIAMKYTTPDALPPVLPVVLYNGEPRWTAPAQLAECIPRFPAALAPYIPQVRYLYLDEGRMATSEQLAERNLAAAVFRLEQDASHGAVQEMIDSLDEWLDVDTQAEIRRSLCVFLIRSYGLSNSLPAGRTPDTIQLSEVRTMLGERLQTWFETEGVQKVAAEREAHGLVALIRQLVSDGTLTVDQGRERIQGLITAGEIPEEAGQTALDQLG